MSISNQHIVQRIVNALEVDHDLFDSQLSQLSQPVNFSNQQPRGSAVRVPVFSNKNDGGFARGESPINIEENIFSQDVVALLPLALSQNSAFVVNDAAAVVAAADDDEDDDDDEFGDNVVAEEADVRWAKQEGAGPLSAAARERLIDVLIGVEQASQTTRAVLRRILTAFAKPSFQTEICRLISSRPSGDVLGYLQQIIGSDFSSLPTQPGDEKTKDKTDGEALIWSCLLASVEICPEIEAIVGEDYSVKHVQAKYNKLFAQHVMKYRQREDFNLDLSLKMAHSEWPSIARSATLMRLLCQLICPVRQKVKFLKTVSKLAGQRNKRYNQGGEAPDHSVRLVIIYETEGEARAQSVKKSLKPVARRGAGLVSSTPRPPDCHVLEQRSQRVAKRSGLETAGKPPISRSAALPVSSSSSNLHGGIAVGVPLRGQTPMGGKKSPAPTLPDAPPVVAEYRRLNRPGTTCRLPIEDQLKQYFTVPFRRLSADSQLNVLKDLTQLITANQNLSGQDQENAPSNTSSSKSAGARSRPASRAQPNPKKLRRCESNPNLMPRNLGHDVPHHDFGVSSSSSSSSSSNSGSLYIDVEAPFTDNRPNTAIGPYTAHHPELGCSDWDNMMLMNLDSLDDSILMPSNLDF